MKKIIIKPQANKIISSERINPADFFPKVCEKLGGFQEVRHSPFTSEFSVKNSLMLTSYRVKIDVHHRRVRYTFGSENIIIAIIFMIFGGMLLYKGRPDTYFFWAAILSVLVYWVNNLLTRQRISDAIIKSLPAKEETAPEYRGPYSISRQQKCPACGCFLHGFEAECPDCGLTINPNQESVSNYRNYKIKIFYKKT